jgi:hypothetical protein
MTLTNLLPTLRRLIPDQRVAVIADTDRGRLAEECSVAEVGGLTLSVRFDDGTKMTIPFDDLDFVASINVVEKRR